MSYKNTINQILKFIKLNHGIKLDFAFELEFCSKNDHFLKQNIDFSGVYIKPEIIPYQYEIVTDYGPDVISQIQLINQFIDNAKNILRDENLFIFDPQPDFAEIGSSLQVHLSINDNSSHILDRKILDFILNGLLESMIAFFPVFAPNEFSYKRFDCESRLSKLFVPRAVCWGYKDNRSSALRLIKDDRSNYRIEHRVAGSDANIEKVIIAILCGVLHGLQLSYLSKLPAIYGVASDKIYINSPCKLRLFPKNLEESYKESKENRGNLFDVMQILGIRESYLFN